MSAAESLELVRASRRTGNLAACLEAANACVEDAETEHDHESRLHALIGCGRLLLSRGEPNLALPYFDEAARTTAAARKLKRWTGVTKHWTFLALRDAGEHRRSMYSFGVALEAFEDAGARCHLACLSADLLEGQLQQNSTPENAVAALNFWRSCALYTETPRERLVAAANTMSAASMLGLHKRFFPALDALEAAIHDCYRLCDGEDVARSLCVAAEATNRLFLFERGANLAEDALRLALARGERLIAEQAGEVLGDALAEKAG